MAATALAQEKVWFEKPTYDKAARLHFERLAKLEPLCKVVGDKIVDQNCEANDKSLVIAPPQDQLVIVPPEDQVAIVPPQDQLIGTNEQSIVNSSKKSKDKNNKAAKRHRNMKKSKSDAVEPKEQITVQQESQQSICPIILASGSLANEISKARQHIKKSLQCMNGIAACTDVSIQDVVARVATLEKDNQELRSSVQELKGIVKQLETKLANNSWPSLQICPAKPAEPTPAAKADEGDDDVDLFGSDSEGEDAEATKIREERVAAYAAKKSKKPALIAKSNIILDVKPWDDETDMKAMEEEVRKIQCDGLRWGAAKLVPLAFGIHKLQIACVVEDEKVSVDWLTEAIQDMEDFVQSVDIAAFNKV